MAQLWGFSMKLLYVIQRALARWIDIYTLSLRARLRVWQFKISILHPSRVQDDKTKLRDDSTISPVTEALLNDNYFLSLIFFGTTFMNKV